MSDGLCNGGDNGELDHVDFVEVLRYIFKPLNFQNFKELEERIARLHALIYELISRKMDVEEPLNSYKM